ncbi:hypothetical protein [Neorhodopirellula pilleata]|uniref:Phage integrase family protein n=1 Tax=Neorhodopirellula pilleata TaxID=2714738 RepID=A0A5C5ZWG1_9BACT|nr:hypothetical protein [Neorhodopirellula pilleata]TWT91427.1 hypothetical protein Pla100_52770 [Neorhodopirellula pilleata]TWT91476.1 hypothetical protein Pla100_53260 [Neorhodopirellula pilleata]
MIRPIQPHQTLHSLDDYFRLEFLPEAIDRGLSNDRIGELKQAVFRWKWWTEKGRESLTGEKDRTVSPGLGDVTPQALSEFRRSVIGQEIPGRDGKSRKVSPRSLNKTLQAIEQILAAAVEDGTLDESRGLVRVRKVPQPRQIGKLVIPDETIAAIFKACDVATWPDSAGSKPIDPPSFWRAAVVMFATYGMRTQDLIRYEPHLRPIRWSSIRPAGINPSENGSIESPLGWLAWVPNKTRGRKSFPLCLPITPAVGHWLGRWRESFAPDDQSAALFPCPLSKDGVYGQWRRILAEAEAKPRPRLEFDADGNVEESSREYLIKHLRCTAGTRAESHGSTIGYTGVGRWITGHVSNDVFERHYHGQERPIFDTLTTLPMPTGILPTDTQSPMRLRVVG